MNEADNNPVNHRKRRLAWPVGLLAVGAIGGGLLALNIPANAAETATSAGVAAPSAAAQQAQETPGQRADETPLTGSDAEKARAAALKAVPGATIDRVETDADGAVYEAHVTRSDGSKATVLFDKDFNVTSVEEGMGKGAPKAQPSR